MNIFKKSVLSVALISAVSLSSVAAYAAGVGVVDLDKVVSNYSKAEDVSTDLKNKEIELQKFLTDAQKKLKEAATPVEKKQLEDKLTAEFKTRSDSFKDAQVKEWKQVEDNVYGAINQTAKDQKLDLVLNKASVLVGGTDISDDVIKVLNKK